MTDPDIRHGPLEDLHGSLGAKLVRESKTMLDRLRGEVRPVRLDQDVLAHVVFFFRSVMSGDA